MASGVFVDKNIGATGAGSLDAACEGWLLLTTGCFTKMSECQTKAGNQECFEKITHFHYFCYSHSLTLDMQNNFCFHVYAQKSLIIAENCNDFFWTSSSSPSPVTLDVIELVPS